VVEPTSDIAPYYAAADCFALPTSYDTFSLVTLEAMASGLPVIVSRAAGISELLADGVNALLLQTPTDVVELAGCLGRLIDDHALRRELADKGRLVAEQHSWDRVSQRTLEIYRSACAGIG
jgi:UDP-glucose:(heptosyl)LPS alpha-1,3-glucosyltransferase